MSVVVAGLLRASDPIASMISDDVNGIASNKSILEKACERKQERSVGRGGQVNLPG